MLGGIENECRTRSEKRTGIGRDDGPVLKFNCRGCLAGEFLSLPGRHGGPAIGSGEFGLLHDELYLVHLILIGPGLRKRAESIVIAPYDFVSCRIAADILVAHAEAHHIDAHISRRLVRILPVDALENGIQHRENLNVPVVVHCNLAVGLKVERVDHIDIVEIRRGRLVCNVDRMLQRQIPHREGLELGITRLYAALVLLVELAETDGHLAASRARGSNDDEGSGCLDIVVFSESLV